MVTNIPTALLRNFVAIVEQGTLLSASQRVFLSQSALSYQLTKLEEMVGQSVFHRDGRRLILTVAGKSLLEYSRKILSLHDEVLNYIGNGLISEPVRLGIVQDFSENFMRDLLVRFAHDFPDSQVYVKVARTHHLRKLLAEGELDIIIGIVSAEDNSAIRSISTLWFGTQEAAERPVVPLALLEAPCKFRAAALSALDQIGRRYRIVVEAPNLATLRAAVEGGLGITCRTSLFAASSLLLDRQVLPALPQIGLILSAAEDALRPTENLHQAARLAIADI